MLGRSRRYNPSEMMARERAADLAAAGAWGGGAGAVTGDAALGMAGWCKLKP